MQFITFALLVAAANAGLLPAGPTAVVQPGALIQQRLIQPAPVLHQVAQPILTKQVVDEYDPNPQYCKCLLLSAKVFLRSICWILLTY